MALSLHKMQLLPMTGLTGRVKNEDKLFTIQFSKFFKSGTGTSRTQSKKPILLILSIIEFLLLPLPAESKKDHLVMPVIILKRLQYFKKMKMAGRYTI